MIPIKYREVCKWHFSNRELRILFRMHSSWNITLMISYRKVDIIQRLHNIEANMIFWSFSIQNLQCLSKKLSFLAIYEVKWGHFKVQYSNLKVLSYCWGPVSTKIWFRRSKRGATRLSTLICSKVRDHQS